MIKSVKSNWNGIKKMVNEVEYYHNKTIFQATWNRKIMHPDYKL